jgi:sugar phosphate isomerase/epimerase
MQEDAIMAVVTTCASLGFSNYMLEQAAQHIAARGFRQIEITHLAFYSLHYTLAEVTAERVKAMLARYGLAATAMNYNAGWLDSTGFPHLHRLDDPAEAQQFETIMDRLLADAGQLGIRVLTVPFLRRRPGASEREQRAEMEQGAGIISRLADKAAALGVRLALEAPHVRLLYYNLPQLAQLLALISSRNVGVVLDSSHWQVVGYDLDEYFALVGDRLCHVHLRDASGDINGAAHNLEMTAGKGQVDFGLLGRKLDSIGYSGQVSLEFEYRVMALADIDAEYDAGIAHLQRCGWTFPPGVQGRT